MPTVIAPEVTVRFPESVSVPELTVVTPLYVLAPERSAVPTPLIVTFLDAPLSTPLMVRVVVVAGATTKLLNNPTFSAIVCDPVVTAIIALFTPLLNVKLLLPLLPMV